MAQRCDQGRDATSWTPGLRAPQPTRCAGPHRFRRPGHERRQVTWKADFTSNQEGCEPEILDVGLNADVAVHGFFSRSSPVVKANVIYSGFYETPAISWRDKSLRGHLQATRLYVPQPGCHVQANPMGCRRGADRQRPGRPHHLLPANCHRPGGRTRDWA